MKQIFLLQLVFFITSTYLIGQDAVSLHETGKKFLMQGDYDNAILVLKKVNGMEPGNLQYAKDLTNAYLYKGDYENAKTIVDKLLEDENTDESVYYTAHSISLAKNDSKNAEKILKKGLKKFENSGLLYNAYGELLGSKNDQTAIIQWEKGIEKDPNFPSNYYNASRFYFYGKHLMAKVWSIYYAEIFINLESYTKRTLEIKAILLDSYKKLMSDLEETKTGKNDFENRFIETLKLNKETVANGVVTANLIMLRTRFILNWYNTDTILQSTLFERQQQLLKEGLFDSYNYWLFEPTQNIDAFENYIKLNANAFEQFSKYMQNRVLKITNTEYFKKNI